MTWITDADTVQWDMIWVEHGRMRKTEMDGSGTPIADSVAQSDARRQTDQNTEESRHRGQCPGAHESVDLRHEASSGAVLADDGATRTHQDAVDSDCSVLTRTEFDEVTDAGSSTAPHMTWVIDLWEPDEARICDNVQWCMIWV